VENLVPRAPFKRLIQEIMANHKTDLRITSSAVDALREISEATLTKGFGEALNLAISLGKRTTIQPKDMQFAFADILQNKPNIFNA
jgi:histone H3/H4